VWTVRPISLEELTLAYMSAPTADAMSGLFLNSQLVTLETRQDSRARYVHLGQSPSPLANPFNINTTVRHARVKAPTEPSWLARAYDDGMGFPNLQREATRARSVYLGALRRLHRAMGMFNEAAVPLVPNEDGRLAPWTSEDVAVMRSCAEAWRAVVSARLGYDAALHDLDQNEPRTARPSASGRHTPRIATLPGSSQPPWLEYPC
jgi:hypothetical protein